MKNFSTQIRQQCTWLLFCIFCSACSTSVKHLPKDELIIGQHHQLVEQLINACLVESKNLHQAINQFKNNPSQINLEKAKSAWATAKNKYSLFEATRFSGHLIDEMDTLINAWPIDEVYIDYVADQSTGIINQPEIEISSKTLLELNEKQGETNISIGFHAIEFLLWGQDTDPNGPGNRPLTDFTTDPLASRRTDYLHEAADLLVLQFKALHKNWQKLVLESNDLSNTITGLGTFIKAELVGERIQVALDTYDQEDEQSCFSDLTNNDIIHNIIGVKTLLTGSAQKYQDNNNKTTLGLINLFNDNHESTQLIMKNISQSLDLMHNLNLPFDQAISPEHPESRDVLIQVTQLMNVVANELRTLQYKKYGH